MTESARADDGASAVLGCGAGFREGADLHGRFRAVLRECADGPVLWEGAFDNVVCTAGKAVALDAFLAGSSYTVVGPYLGLIASASFSAVSAADIMASHAGWLEAGGAHAPTYSGARGTAAWSAAAGGSKALSAGLTFTFTGAGTVQGAFLVFGPGAVSTVDSTAGTLYSAGAFGTAQPVIAGNTLTVSYTASL